ncbi:MAG: sigma-70 family RNA polymerase sigma factor [Erysipelotrichaceae bacterium]|nr:sigma-70 family RNA polymerase sigma factor [Erysipelotrichaceae bacterium]
MKLIKIIREGKDGEAAFAQLLKQFRPMIFKIIYRNRLDRGDFRIDENDLFQEASLALYKAVFSYEEEREMAFSSYAYLVIRSRVRELLRTAGRVYNDEVVSLDSSKDYSLKFCVRQDPAAYHQEEQFKEGLVSFMNSLGSEDRLIFELKSQDLSYKEISKRLNMSTKKIDNRLRILRKRLKKHLEKLGLLLV